MVNTLLKSKTRFSILLIVLFLEGCITSYKLPLVVYRKEDKKVSDGFVISSIDSTTISGNRYSIVISKYKKGLKNGKSYQYIVDPNKDSLKIIELYRAGRYKNNKRRGIWWYYDNGKKIDWEYWGKKKSYRTAVKNKFL